MKINIVISLFTSNIVIQYLYIKISTIQNVFEIDLKNSELVR